jgi:hypothetical protein
VFNTARSGAEVFWLLFFKKVTAFLLLALLASGALLCDRLVTLKGNMALPGLAEYAPLIGAALFRPTTNRTIMVRYAKPPGVLP